MDCVNRRDLQALSRTRLTEARTLLASGHSDGAYYLAGYAIECALKACIARGTMRHDFPDRKRVDASHTHSLRELVRVANLEAMLYAAEAQDRAFSDNWEVVQQWSEQSRYLRTDSLKARKLVDAISNRRHGVMRWLTQYW